MTIADLLEKHWWLCYSSVAAVFFAKEFRRWAFGPPEPPKSGGLW
jgi:hypothetical protein